MSDEKKLELFTEAKAAQSDPVSVPMSPAHQAEFDSFCYVIDYVGAK